MSQLQFYVCLIFCAYGVTSTSLFSNWKGLGTTTKSVSKTNKNENLTSDALSNQNQLALPAGETQDQKQPVQDNSTTNALPSQNLSDSNVGEKTAPLQSWVGNMLGTVSNTLTPSNPALQSTLSSILATQNTPTGNNPLLQKTLSNLLGTSNSLTRGNPPQNTYNNFLQAANNRVPSNNFQTPPSPFQPYLLNSVPRSQFGAGNNGMNMLPQNQIVPQTNGGFNLSPQNLSPNTNSLTPGFSLNSPVLTFLNAALLAVPGPQQGTLLYQLLKLLANPIVFMLIQESPVGQKVKNFSSDMINLGMNSAGRLFSNTGEVVKKTDSVLDEKSEQFKRVNSANSNFMKAAIETAGTAATKVSQTGTNALGTVQNVIYDPAKYINPWPYMKGYIPFAKPTAEEQWSTFMLEQALEKLKTERRDIYYDLMGNSTVLNFLKTRPKTYLSLLQNPDELRKILNDPTLLYFFQQAS